MPVTYNDGAYKEVMTWTAKTKIKYAPNRKSGKSFHRYGKYMKAKTVGEALSLGSFGLDLLFDYEKGLLWSTGGPKRQRPPEVSKEAGITKEDLKKMCQTDRLLGTMYNKWKMWKNNFALLQEHGVTRQHLKELNDMQDPEGGRDSIVVAIGRREAQEKAKEILQRIAAEGDRKVTDYEVLSCLRLWGFKENTNRGNVMPDGAKFVHSDTVGVIKMSTCERTLVTVGTKRYPEFTKLITKWLHDRLPSDLAQEFTYTSININKNYAGKLHRDGNNVGPSFIKAFGDFQKGELNYWPSDTGKGDLEDLKEKDRVSLNIKDKLLLFDGNRGHCVSPFVGERYSLVFFSIRTWDKIPKEEIKVAKECGIPIPTKASMAYARSLLAPSCKGGYRAWHVPQELGNKSKRSSTKMVSSPSPAKTPERGTKRKLASMADVTLTPSPVRKRRDNKPSGESDVDEGKIADWSSTDVVHFTGATCSTKYMTRRCQRAHGHTVEKLLGSFTYTNQNGEKRKYGKADLAYDIKGGRLRVGERNHVDVNFIALLGTDMPWQTL